MLLHMKFPFLFVIVIIIILYHSDHSHHRHHHHKAHHHCDLVGIFFDQIYYIT